MEKEIEFIEGKAREIRRDVIRMILKAGSGHTGGSLGTADIFASLYFDLLNINAKNYFSDERDYFFLSNAHICPVWYATLANAGFFPKKELSTLRKLGSRLQGHPHFGELPGIENAGGPLGQGLSIAIGTAMILKQEGKTNQVVVMVGDGELDEGQCWEAFMLTKKYCLGNLTIIIDKNNLQLDGATDKIMPHLDLTSKLSSFGFDVYECDGNNVLDFHTIFRISSRKQVNPKAIIAHTIMGKGVSFMENDFKWHGKAPSKKEAELALKELDDV